MSSRMTTATTERVNPVGTTDCQASRLWTKALKISTIDAAAAPTGSAQVVRNQPGARVRTSSTKPTSAAIAAMIRPTVSSHIEKFDHCMFGLVT